MATKRVFQSRFLHAATNVPVRPDSSVSWSAYPALLLAGAFALGVLGESALGSRAMSLWLGGAGVGLLTFSGVQWWDQARLVTLAPLGRIVAVVLTVGFLGGARHAMYRSPSPRALSPAVEESDETTALQGVVVDAPERTEEATRFTLEVDTLFGSRDTAAVDGRVPASEKGINLQSEARCRLGPLGGIHHNPLEDRRLVTLFDGRRQGPRRRTPIHGVPRASQEPHSQHDGHNPSEGRESDEPRLVPPLNA